MGNRHREELSLSDDQVLFDQVGALLEADGGWHYEPSTTPGGLPSWCLDPGGLVACSVNVVDGAVVLYFPEDDHEITLDGLDGLTAWLGARNKRSGADS
jgi:hypothetical protein